MAAVNAYLSFSGNCEEAFDFYRSVFGGEFSALHRFSDLDLGMPMSDDELSMIMHVALPIGGTTLMGSDSPSKMGAVNAGNHMSLAIAPDNEDHAREIFDGLSVGGTITMPLNKAPWGALFGMLTDKYGFNWMVNYELTPNV